MKLIDKSFFPLLLVSIIAMMFGYQCSYQQGDFEDEPPPTNFYPGTESYNFTQSIYGKDGELEYVIQSHKEAIYRNTNEAFYDNLRILYWTEDEETQEIIPVQLTSEHGKLNIQSKNIEAWGNVIIIRKGSVRVETERIFFDNQREVIYTLKNENVKVSRIDGSISQGRHLRADMGLNYYKLEDPVSSTIKNGQAINSF